MHLDVKLIIHRTELLMDLYSVLKIENKVTCFVSNHRVLKRARVDILGVTKSGCR